MLWKSTCVRKIIPKFVLCTLNLWFWNPWLTFISGQKKTHTVLNRPQIVKLTFIIFFSKCCTGHLKCAFGNPEENISTQIPSFCSKTENFHSNNLAQEKILNLFLWTGRLRFWESCLTVLLKVHVFFCSIPKMFKENKFSRLIFPFISLCTMIGGLAHMTKQFCKKTTKSLKLQKW